MKANFTAGIPDFNDVFLSLKFRLPGFPLEPGELKFVVRLFSEEKKIFEASSFPLSVITEEVAIIKPPN